MIQAKKKAVIQKGNGLYYSPATFATYKQKNSFMIDDPVELLSLVKPFELDGRKFITFDTETHPHFPNSQRVPRTVVRRWVGKGKTAVPQDYPFCISICDGVNMYTIFDSIANNFKKFKQLKPLFEDPEIEKIAHNTKFDMHMFANADLKIVGKLHDTVVATKIADENKRSYQLRDLAEGKGITIFEHMVDSYKQINKVTDYRQIPTDLLSEYANADVWNAYIAFIEAWHILKRDELMDLYNAEMEVMVAFYVMERHGMKADKSYEASLKLGLQILCDTAEQAIYDTAGGPFNINSGPQLAKALFADGIPEYAVPKTDKGNLSLKAEVLESLDGKYESTILANVLTFRKYSKLLGTYANGIYDQRDAEDYVHCSINQTEATTGRSSIVKPALQTLPKKDTRIRKAFIPDNVEDCSVFMDLDQIEYRLYAHYAKITDLLHKIDEGYDIHKATAAIIYNKDIEEVTDEERSNGKTINFALVYGVGIDHLAELLHCSKSDAESIKARYFAAIPEARPFIQTVHQVISARGYVKNFYGRRRRLSTNDCYKAPNALIQGCAADYVKSRTVAIYKYLNYNNMDTTMRMFVHDELVFNIPPYEQYAIPTLRWLLSDFTSFRCKITAGVELGNPSWGEKEPYISDKFVEPEDKAYLDYNVFDGTVFDINKEV